MGGAILGASPICAGLLSSRFGRRTSIVIASRFALVACILSACLTVSPPLYYVGRALIGLCSGVFSSVVPMYQSELAPATARGRFGSTYQLAFQLGALSAFVVIRIMLLPKCVNDAVGIICVQLLQGAAVEAAANYEAVGTRHSL